jgi:hypothetical protein
MRLVIARVLPAVLLAVVTAAGSGCAKRHHISIESNSCWFAIVDNQRDAVIRDCGSKAYRVSGEVHCVAVTNTDTLGFVRVRVDDGAWSENSTPLGTAEACR